MADVYAYAFFTIGILISWPALLIALNLLLPSKMAQVEDRLVAAPWRAFMSGVPVTAVTILLTLAALDAGSGITQGFGYMLGGLLLALWMFGGAGMARLMGKRMGRMSERSELSRVSRGTAVFVLASLCPVVGWFIFLPLAGITAVGAALPSLRRRRNLDEQIAIQR
ncbi:MAG: hypothetical protein KAG66_16565 [Methylococcales bacterium]|nr:hypothetical protein [Methylococcales bacterium]